jgi:hypothetical protein
MALALYDRVKETTTVTGTGTATLLGATTGFQSFAVVGNANTTYYCIADQGGANWEVGIGTYTASGTTLARTTVLSSSNADALVAFTAGIKDVFVTYPSSKGLWKDASGNAIGLGTPAAFVGTNITGTASGLTAGNVTTNANLTGAITSTGNATSLGSFTSLQLATALTDETGSGSAVFATSPTLVTPVLGTPASGVVTNLTGTASININGTVGATTATTGAFTNLSYTGTLTGSTGVLNIGSGQVYKDASGNVGIGTNSPQTRLTIQDTGSGANIGMMVRNGDAVNFHRIGIGYNAGASTGYIPANAVFVDGTGGGGYGALGGLAIGTGSSAPVIFGTNATPRMRIDPSGNVGIGTSSPSSYGKLGLSVSATASAVTNVIGFQNSAGVDAASLRIAGYNYVNNVQTAIDFIQNSASNFQSQMSFSTHSGASLLERMRIDSSGNVGIGTSSPTASTRLTLSDTNTFKLKLTGGTTQNAIKFDTAGTANTYYLGAGNNLLSGGDKGFLIYDDTNGRAKFYVEDTAGETRTLATTLQTFYTNASERMRIDSSGNVGIGTTADSGAKMKISGATAGSQVLYVVNTTGSGNQGGIRSFLGASANNTSSFHFNGLTDTVANWYLYGNGTSSWSSDERLKKNIETTREGYINDVMKLRVVKYNWKNAEEGTPKELGLIAQEVEQVFPGLVQDDFNNVSEDDPIFYKQLKGSVLPMILLKTIQEQQTLIEALTARLTALEAK